MIETKQKKFRNEEKKTIKQTDFILFLAKIDAPKREEKTK